MRKISPTSDVARLYRHGDRSAPAAELDFSINVNPLGPPSSVVAALFPSSRHRQADVLSRYPDPDCQALTEMLARRHTVDPCQVVVGNGANDLIYLAARALRPRRVAIVEPTYTEYLRASLAAGAVVEHWLAEPDGFEPQPFNPEGADLVWVCNPNNPTGQLWPAGMLRHWIETFFDTTFVVDEAFLPFLAEEGDHSVIPALQRLRNLVVLRSLTKVYTIPGLRLGYLVSSAEMAQRLRAQVVPWSVNGLAQIAGLAALEDLDFLRETHSWLRANLSLFMRQLADCSSCLEPLPSRTNFILVRVKGVTADWVAGTLAERGIAVRDASNFVGLDEHYLRVALRLPQENQRLLQELRGLFLEG